MTDNTEVDENPQPKPVQTDQYRECTRCLFHTGIPGISFDERGMCSYCTLSDFMEQQYPTGPAGRLQIEAMADEMRVAGKGREYDCVVGVSGGCDSSFLIHTMVELGLRPLAVHFDNTWNSPIATSNIYAILDELEVPLQTYVVDNKEYDDIYRSFMLAGVRDLEAPTDIGFMGVLYRTAEQHGIKHIVEGHSFRTEGVSPLGWLYMDGGYVRSVHAKFGRLPMKTYPGMDFAQFVKWAAFSGIKRVRPLYWLDYDKEAAKRFLSDTYGWEWYGGHHLENRFTAFYHSYFLPRRWGIDMRILGYSGMVRSGQLTRAEAVAEMAKPPHLDDEVLDLVKKRLGFDAEEFDQVMALPKHHYSEFRTYKRRFELLRPLFWVLYKLDRVPKSFYVKFCQRSPVVGRDR